MKTSRTSFTWKSQVLPIAVSLIVASIRSASAADYPTTILADHPVAYYRLEEPNGSANVNDSSGNAFDGFVTYVTQADGITVYPRLGFPGIFTNGALFAPSTGVGQGRIEVPVNSTLNPTTDGTNGAPFTAELWVMANSAQSSVFGVPLDDSSDFNQPAPYNNSAGWNFYQTQGSSSTWSFSLRPNPGFVGNGPAVVAGQWTHLVLTYDGTNASFYVNGTKFNTYAVSQFLAQNGTSPMIMGYGPPTGQKPFDGAIDEVAVYNYALTATQVTNHYNIGTNEITFVPTPPSFTSQPSDTSISSGVPVTFSVQAVGTAPLSYQWNRVGSGSIPSATGNTYTFTPIYPADNNAQFFVTVTNIAGHTNSTTATLTVLTNTTIAYNPFSITRRVGGYAAFRTVPTGAKPVSYQWHVVSNAVDQIIPGATSDTLWLSKIQASASGNAYYAHVMGPFESADSSQATLTVVSRASNAPVTLYSKIVMADSPVAYWRLDETSGTNALDTAGSFDGGYSFVPNDLTYGYATGIPHETDAAIHVTNTAIMTVPYALELNPVSGPWSVEFWLQPTSVDQNNFRTPISSEDNTGLAGTTLFGWNIYLHVASYWTWNIFNGGGGGSFTSEFVDHPIVPGQWYHMVLTDDGTNMIWFVNNRQVFSTTVKVVSFVQNGINGDPAVAGGPLTLAVRSDGAFGGWDGGIDEVATYNYVLGPQQIQNHFLNSTHINITRTGGKEVLTWPVGSLQSSTSLSGTYTNVVGATSPFTNSATGSPAFYRVQLQ